MTQVHNPYKYAGQFFYLSSVLHIVAIATSFGALFAPLIVAVFLWAAVGYGLINRPRRRLAYFGFLGALIGVVVSVSIGTQVYGITRYAMMGITLADLGAAILLFGALWRSSQRA